jgi:hypothetical protein
MMKPIRTAARRSKNEDTGSTTSRLFTSVFALFKLVSDSEGSGELITSNKIC